MKVKTPQDLKQYVGKTVTIEGKPIVIETIVGNIQTPAFFEINGEHLLGMLRFYAQINGDKSITEEQFKAFEEIQYHVEKVPVKKEKEVVQ
jgi:hypothetical protein